MSDHHDTGTLYLNGGPDFVEALDEVKQWLENNPLHTPQGMQVVYNVEYKEWMIYLRTMSHNT